MAVDKPIALKEWASAIKALENGTQIFIMRKGGIVEETRDFQVEADAFYLYPTYEHQRKALLKEEFQPMIDKSLESWSIQDSTVDIRTYAKLVHDFEIMEQAQLQALLTDHIWTENFTEERLKWKRKNPLHLMVLRVYKLDKPMQVSIQDAYLGCKSWIQLLDAPAEPSMKPVLSDEEFTARLSQIRQKLEN
ncbi:DUF1802 family protein [Paenibacillus hexagrammi]|uniref:DUF1802 family protein n=1 Tax=Paenibacillus hexagrammi TaxID=2908839 RepID=A0ABY3SLD1_9BACL|nr:DUF1802 family protein [Paenibacillus sp. YPD9-1]UJF34683.1 DUF1802 family protein [Paenibacillus sp. YPD9-1]